MRLDKIKENCKTLRTVGWDGRVIDELEWLVERVEKMKETLEHYAKMGEPTDDPVTDSYYTGLGDRARKALKELKEEEK